MTPDYSEEILKLMALQSRVPADSWFPGDSNFDALEAQILVLRGLSVSGISQANWYPYRAALAAQDWKDGKTTTPPSETWAKQVKP
jgi:hypothetical protein